VTKQEIKDYLQLIREAYKVSTIKRKIASIKALFNYLEFEDILTDKNPFRLVRLKLKPPRILPKTIDIREVERILKCIYQKRNNVKGKSIQQIYFTSKG